MKNYCQQGMCNLFCFYLLTYLAHYNIRRTCTSEIKINMFMVDTVCMSESNRRGRMCFCEDISCNDASRNTPMEFIRSLIKYRIYSDTFTPLHSLVLTEFRVDAMTVSIVFLVVYVLNWCVQFGIQFT